MGAADTLGTRPRISAPAVILIRHGCTDLNGESSTSTERVRGWTDVPLNSKGRAQARSLASTLSNVPLASICCSNLKRAIETAEIIAETNVGKPMVHKTAELRPWGLGEFQGKPVTDEVTKQIEAYVEHPDRKVPGGESFNAFQQRAIPYLMQLFSQAEAKKQILAVVTHTRVLRLMGDYTEGRRPGGKDMMEGTATPPGGYEIYRPSNGRNWRKDNALHTGAA